MKGDRAGARVAGMPALWFVGFAGPVLWSLQLLANYVLVSLACRTGVIGGEVLGIAGVHLLLIGIMLALALVVLYAGLTAFRIARRIGINEESGAIASLTRRRFMAFAGVLYSIMFAIGIIWSGLPAFFVTPCV